MNKYILKYLIRIIEAKGDETIIADIINKIYEDGFEDGVNNSNK